MAITNELDPVVVAARSAPFPLNLAVLAAIDLVKFFVGQGKDPKVEIERLATIAAQEIIDEA